MNEERQNSLYNNRDSVVLSYRTDIATDHVDQSNDKDDSSHQSAASDQSPDKTEFRADTLSDMARTSIRKGIDEDDESRSEATFSFSVENFSQLRDSALSPSWMVRNLPWRILIMPRTSQAAVQDRLMSMTKYLGYFLQCNGESESASWSCQASAELRIVSVDSRREPFSRKITHVFNAKENDWGYATYKGWNEVLNPDNGFCLNDKVTFEVKVVADAPHGVFWDSKRHTGYVGLKNQGATCYMNSLLQVLFFTNKLRKAVYRMPTEADDGSKSVALALQRVFHDLQFCDKSVGTKRLTKSFGWEAFDSFMQHDVQEFLRVLMDKLEIKMKGTSVEGQIPRLFQGQMVSYIQCKNINYTSSRTESFYDIQLSIKGNRDIYESFADYVQTESLDGENKYDAGSHGLQDADKGIKFTSFPPVLHLHLMRFQYDPITDSSVKSNDRFEFPYVLNLRQFLSSKAVFETDENRCESDLQTASSDATEKSVKPCEDADAMEVDKAEEVPIDMTTYILHAVLVHSGDNHGGHYVVFINPACDGKWCKFDDDVVSRCTEAEAIKHNFGGGGPTDSTVNNSPGAEPDLSYVGRHTTSAYMLVYIRKSSLPDTLCPVMEKHIPPALLERLSEERKIEMVRRREKNEAHFYANFRLILEDQFVGHQGNDLFDSNRVVFHEVRVRRSHSLCEVMQQIAEQMALPVAKLRLWDFVQRSNQTYRAAVIDVESDWHRPIFDVMGDPPHTFFLEVAPLSPPSPVDAATLAPFDKKSDVLFFFRYYDPRAERLHYMGHMYVPIKASISFVMPELMRRAQLVDSALSIDVNTAKEQLAIFEEVGPNQLEAIENVDTPLDQEMDELMDGDIIVYQRIVDQAEIERRQLRLPSCEDYFTDLFYRIEVCFVDKTNPQDIGFLMTLSLRLNFGEFVQAVAARLGIDARKLQLFRPQNYRETPGQPIKLALDTSLKEFTYLSRNRNPRKLFYQKMTISLDELESKRPVKLTWLSIDHKEEAELTVYPPKTGTVADLLAEVRAQVTLAPHKPFASGGGQLRLMDIIGHRITELHKPESRLVDLVINNNVNSSKTLRVEQVPDDQTDIDNDSILVSVVHFQKDISSCFGHPFLIKIVDGQTFDAIRCQLQKHLQLTDKEFEKYTPAVVSNGHVRYFHALTGPGSNLNNSAVGLNETNGTRGVTDGVGKVPSSEAMIPDDGPLSAPPHTRPTDDGSDAGNQLSASPPRPRVSLRDFMTGSSIGPHQQHIHASFIARPYIGLEHVNKNSKRARYNYTEKAIKIYN